MFPCCKFPYIQALYKYFYFTPTALYYKCFFRETTLSSHLIVFWKLGDNQ